MRAGTWRMNFTDINPRKKQVRICQLVNERLLEGSKRIVCKKKGLSCEQCNNIWLYGNFWGAKQ